METFLIFGGNGMLAHALARSAELRGKHPILLSRSKCDITNSSDIATAISAHKPTVILNCAAYTKVDACESAWPLAEAINGRAVENLAKQAAERGIKLVHFGSDFVFDGKLTRPYREEDSPNPLSAYGRSKLIGENALLSRPGENWLLLRTAWLYGRHGLSFPRTMVEVAQRGTPLSIVNDQIGSPTFTDDLAEITLDLLNKQATGLFHAVNHGAVSWFDLACETLKAFGIDHPVAPIPTAQWIAKRPGQAKRPPFSALDVSKLEKTLGRSVTDWKQAVHAFAEQVRVAGGFF